MKKLLGIAILLLSLTSCHKDFLRVSLLGHSWKIVVDDQFAYAHFFNENCAATLQTNTSTGANQIVHGTYETDGHRVDITGENSINTSLVRTFSNLKNSRNKNFSTVQPARFTSMEGSVWSTIQAGDYRMLFFHPDGQVTRATFDNVSRKEGVPYGWSREELSYTLDGGHLTIGDQLFTLYPEIMASNSTAYLIDGYPVIAAGSSSLSGSFWTCQTGSYPGYIVFVTGQRLVRVLLANASQYVHDTGSYTLAGNKLSVTIGDAQETVTISGGAFTLFERTYKRFEEE